MWKVFQRWGKVTDIFISRRLDKWGHRFGFVRFLEVKNEQSFQRELDSIRIGSTKLHVNKPRYERDDRQKPRYGREDWWKVAKKPNTLEGNRPPHTRKVWREVKRHQTFAQIVKASTTSSNQAWKGISFDTEEANINWMEGSHIARVSDYSKVNKVLEEVIQNGLGRLNAKYLGENAILIQGIEGAEIGNLIGENKEWWEANFDFVTPWNSSKTIQNKLVWVRCRGLPLNLWSQQCFGKIVAPVGTLVSIDEKTLTWECLEFARLNVKVPIGTKIWVQKSMRINGRIYNVVLEEETNGGTYHTCCCANENNLSSDCNTSCNGSFDFSSISEWCDNENLFDSEKEKMKEEKTIQSPAALMDRCPQVIPELSSGIGNVSIPDHCGSKVGSGMSKPKLDDALTDTDPINKYGLSFTPATKSAIQDHATPIFGPIAKVAQSASEGFSESFVKESELGFNGNADPEVINSGPSTEVLIKCNTTPLLTNTHPGREYLGLNHHREGFEAHDEEQRQYVERESRERKFEVQHSRTQLLQSTHDTNKISTISNPAIHSKDLVGHQTSKHMTLIKESIMDPKDFQERRQFWKGESSMKRPISKNRNVLNKGKVSKRKLLRSMVQTICNSLSDDNILNCNRLFWSTRCQSSNSKSATIWSLAKELGVTFSGEEEEILKELAYMENRDKNQRKNNGGKNIVVNEDH